MAPKSKYLFIASMDVDPSKESLFNDVYNTEHCPELSKVAGVGDITWKACASNRVMSPTPATLLNSGQCSVL